MTRSLSHRVKSHINEKGFFKAFFYLGGKQLKSFKNALWDKNEFDFFITIIDPEYLNDMKDDSIDMEK